MSFTISAQVANVYELEDGTDDYGLEDGTDFILEEWPMPSLYGLESGTDTIGSEDGDQIALESGPGEYTDLTNYLLYASQTVKFNTIDFTLSDAPAASALLAAGLRTTDPTWTGAITAITSVDTARPGDGHELLTVTGTNTTVLPKDTAPFDLADVPVALTDRYLLEDGVSHFLLESGTDFAGTTGTYLLEGALSYGYSGLSVRTMAGSPPTTLGRATVQQPGLRPGGEFGLSSANQHYAGLQFQINQVTTTWPVGQPVAQIEFGDTPETLAQWTVITAPVVTPVTPPVVLPVGATIYGNVTTGNVTYPAGGGIVTIATATFTVTPPQGHTLTVQVLGQVDAGVVTWSNYVATPRRAVRATLSGGVYTGTWQELPFGTNGAPEYHTTYDLSSGLGLALAAGTYTITIDIDTQGANQIHIHSGWVQASVTTV